MIVAQIGIPVLALTKLGRITINVAGWASGQATKPIGLPEYLQRQYFVPSEPEVN